MAFHDNKAFFNEPNDTGRKITIPILLLLLTLLACLIQAVLYLLIHRKCDDNFWVSRLMMIIPSLVLALTILLIIDNLTYITMSVGIITSRRFVRIFLCVGIFISCWLSYF